MKGIFCTTRAKNNEEYRQELKRKNLIMGIVAICGAAAAGIACWAQGQGLTQLSDYILGVYCGAGVGIAVGCLILIARNLNCLKDEEKLKNSRVKNTDERVLEIRDKAVKAAVFVLLLVTFMGGLIGGIFEPVLIRAELLLLYAFLLTYIIAYQIYKRRM